MKLFFGKTSSVNIRGFMRSCGYAESRSFENGETSYTKSFSGRSYPRFHVYCKVHEGQIIFNLHLDQKQPSYGEQTAHSGEYDGELVEREGGRIKEMWQKSLSVSSDSGASRKQETPKKSFFKKLFGF